MLSNASAFLTGQNENSIVSLESAVHSDYKNQLLSFQSPKVYENGKKTPFFCINFNHADFNYAF